MLGAVLAPDPDLMERAREAARDAVGGEAAISVLTSTTGRVTVRAGGPARPAVSVKVYLDPEKLVNEVRHCRIARDLGLPVPEEVSFDVGPPAVLVTGWSPGEPIDRHPEAAHELGRLLARYYVSEARPPGAADGWAKQVRVRANSELTRLGEMALLGGSQKQRVEQKVEEIVAAVRDRPQVLIHGDLQPEHVLVDPLGRRIVAILDWADSGFADPLFEVARLSLVNRELAEPFLTGAGLANDPMLIGGYRVLWSVLSATWLAERGLTDEAGDVIGALQAL